MKMLTRADYELVDKVVFPIVERCGLVGCETDMGNPFLHSLRTLLAGIDAYCDDDFVGHTLQCTVNDILMSHRKRVKTTRTNCSFHFLLPCPLL